MATDHERRIRRAARRVRAGEAQVADMRRALDDELALAVGSTRLSVSALARAAGLSRSAVYDALDRVKLRSTTTQEEAHDG